MGVLPWIDSRGENPAVLQKLAPPSIIEPPTGGWYAELSSHELEERVAAAEEQLARERNPGFVNLLTGQRPDYIRILTAEQALEQARIHRDLGFVWPPPESDDGLPMHLFPPPAGALDTFVAWRGIIRSLSPEEYEQQAELPLFFGTDEKSRDLWLFQNALYATAEVLEPIEVLAVLEERTNRVRARVGKAVAALEQVESLAGADARRAPIPEDVRIFVWRRDGGACVRCGSKSDLEFDHMIPISMGGANTARNLQLLCASCNRSKGGNLV